jgi:hypothetical protein
MSPGWLNQIACATKWTIQIKRLALIFIVLKTWGKVAYKQLYGKLMQ